MADQPSGRTSGLEKYTKHGQCECQGAWQYSQAGPSAQNIAQAVHHLSGMANVVS
jgi:hypothetical protein